MSHALKKRKHPQLVQHLIGTLFVCVVSGILFFSQKKIGGYMSAALVLLATVSLLAMFFDIFPVLLTAVLSALVWNFLFIPPLFTFHIEGTQNFLMFLMYFLVALVNAVLTIKIRHQEKKVRDKEEKENTIRLYHTLFNSLSHELKTPIATIIGAVDALSENGKDLSEANKSGLLGEISTASDRLHRQVDNLLSMSRLESGMLHPKYDWCDINELVNISISELKDVLIHHKITFEPNIELPFFKLDADFIDRILHNLLHNAIQYTPNFTEIVVKADITQNGLLLTVEDNGNGFPVEEIPFVFEKFYRLPNSKIGGTGLGLSIAKGFTEALKGSIKLQNRPSGGAHFIIEIPSECSYVNKLNHD